MCFRWYFQRTMWPVHLPFILCIVCSRILLPSLTLCNTSFYRYRSNDLFHPPTTLISKLSSYLWPTFWRQILAKQRLIRSYNAASNSRSVQCHTTVKIFGFVLFSRPCLLSFPPSLFPLSVYLFLPIFSFLTQYTILYYSCRHCDFANSSASWNVPSQTHLAIRRRLVVYEYKTISK